MTLTFDPELLVDPPVAPPMSAAQFRGGPLDGARGHKVPDYGPAWVRWRDAEGVHWYAHKSGSKRTYLYVGASPL